MRLVAFFTTIAFVAFFAGDLFAARGRGCGPHPCCAKGACKMMPKSGARLDRCGEKSADAPEAPLMLLAATIGVIDGQRPAANGQRVATPVRDGAPFAIDRPPRA